MQTVPRHTLSDQWQRKARVAHVHLSDPPFASRSCQSVCRCRACPQTACVAVRATYSPLMVMGLCLLGMQPRAPIGFRATPPVAKSFCTTLAVLRAGATHQATTTRCTRRQLVHLVAGAENCATAKTGGATRRARDHTAAAHGTKIRTTGSAAALAFGTLIVQ